ncbi:hypothetical protein E2C01_024677 [Portunus trituberculatus]|uniref:Uncharacterized protein n=1 Tax=Portunus trituberculatus TaxID=210409 RepID=A0A5B7EDH3_PORTR|nr:hypothetical protein [Portunus trituberculatus]
MKLRGLWEIFYEESIWIETTACDGGPCASCGGDEVGKARKDCPGRLRLEKVARAEKAEERLARFRWLTACLRRLSLSINLRLTWNI